jgi:hypothetical protein
VRLQIQKIEQTELNNELKKKEDRLSKIMLAANDGMWDWDLQQIKCFLIQDIIKYLDMMLMNSLMLLLNFKTRSS